MLLAQPDLGMAVIVTAVWGIQFFLAGLPMILVVGLAALGAAGLVGSYFLFSHVASRIDRFLDPSRGVRKSVVEGKSVSVRDEPGGRRILKKNKTSHPYKA